MQYSDNMFLLLSLPSAKIAHSTPGVCMSILSGYKAFLPLL